jgi:GNAT superfamily N-acetyltransferase
MTTFRLSHAQDAPIIAGLHTQSWHNAYRGILSDQFIDEEMANMMAQKWQSRFDQPAENQRIIIAEKEGIPAGFVCLYFHDHPQYGTLIDNLHVIPAFKGLGLGARLMREAASLVQSETGDQHYYLWVLEKNLPSRQFYEHIGGQNAESTLHQMPDGQEHLVYRYVWKDFERLFS